MMEECKSCVNYDESLSYPGTGYCKLWADFMKGEDTCEDHEEVEG